MKGFKRVQANRFKTIQVIIFDYKENNKYNRKSKGFLKIQLRSIKMIRKMKFTTFHKLISDF